MVQKNADGWSFLTTYDCETAVFCRPARQSIDGLASLAGKSLRPARRLIDVADAAGDGRGLKILGRRAKADQISP
jgi:hypothetical protein